MLVGLFEPVAAPWKLDGVPHDFAFGTIDPDWDRMAPFLSRAMERIPSLADIGVRLFFCGPESFTADVHPLLGPAPELDGYWVAAGMNSLGILLGGGVGKVLAHWIVDGVQAAHRPQHPPFGGARSARGCGRQVQRLVRLGVRRVVRGIRAAAAGDAGLSSSALAHVRGSRACSGAQRRGRARHEPDGEAVGAGSGCGRSARPTLGERHRSGGRPMSRCVVLPTTGSWWWPATSSIAASSR